jgi:restriction system protein
MEPNTTNVLAAFEMLLEEIENEVELVNQLGARAFALSNYDQAREAVVQGEKLAAFRARIAEARRDWRDLLDAFTPPAGEEATVEAQRRDLGRIRRGTRTPEEAYRLPILRTLAEMGGAGRTAEVLDQVGELMQDQLKEVDYDPLSSSGSPRWRNSAQWARNTMVNEGLMKESARRGVWEISEAGRRYLLRAES